MEEGGKRSLEVLAEEHLQFTLSYSRFQQKTPDCEFERPPKRRSSTLPDALVQN